jgi:hypothetical protein
MKLNSLKFNTVVVFLFTIVFIWFFFLSKHHPALSEFNVFNVDPFDAVGSIAIQVSFFSSLF